ncbi:Hypothetical predicted protein [Pelobates cultripes]|uniref:Uncharacterized protein n=1 Tax=Pelobates cultripes TaxID=61616 RepID=A0AAD1SRA6_PELCU|nr:Hypothetical predicted protein [Pelobates cultripes]
MWKHSMCPVTSILQKNGIPYRWGNPRSLQVTNEGTLHRITESQTFLQALGLSLTEQPKQPPSKVHRRYVEKIQPFTPNKDRQRGAKTAPTG